MFRMIRFNDGRRPEVVLQLHDPVVLVGVTDERFVFLFVAADNDFGLIVETVMPAPFERHGFSEVPVSVIEGILQPAGKIVVGQQTPARGGTELGNAQFFRELELGMVPAMIGRISFTGELGYEIWVTPDYQLALHDALLEAGEDLGLTHFGGRALNSLRLEKSFGGWTREYTPDYTPYEAGLGRFVSLKKNQFIGRDAALEAKEAGSERRHVTLVVEADGVDDAQVVRVPGIANQTN